jgi:hypothetical protein
LQPLAGTVAGWPPSAVGCQGIVEGMKKRGDRATAAIKDIWCEKIRGCNWWPGER